ncbi:hypothetical protein SAMN04489867_1835 [Pedococcus dokdonensis]|uniref:Uncharacterized protein n=1 Tax=Pedococcus dokdonensis TaxID=443156 RepID=A0A1H0R3Y5_9MICO|nr:hypothetical protein [Pedococcus dokdonensis]SDP24241.1 hypothetical protein SAMN04489867_1835 [Pedococcus dokdonensis]
MSVLHRPVVRAQLALVRAQLAVVRPTRRGPSGGRAGRERGDVPGWVLITLMTAGLVAALWAVAEDQLSALFTDALDSARR